MNSARAYNPNQPREPAGIPTGGRWTLGEGISLPSDIDETAGEEVQVAGAGHHYVPTAVHNKYPFPPETQQVFNQARTGPLFSHRHNFTGHSAYSQAVRQELDQFLKARGIVPEQMTPDQARTFTQQILNSRVPIISDFNRRIWLREIRYWMLRAPRGE